jgi:hypothetical protein
MGSHFINMKMLFYIYIKMTAINTVGTMGVIPGIICLIFRKGGGGVWAGLRNISCKALSVRLDEYSLVTILE